MKRILLGVLVIGCVLGALSALTVAFIGHKQDPAQYKAFDFRTFDQPVIDDAPGCEIRSPKGELMNRIFKGSQPNQLNLEKGTTFTIDCFPIKESEKSTTRN
ncbi:MULTISPECIES: hypothetical protein [Pseudomonas]|jgi:hypothetical protein|uniref:Uncharacterized protein n=4 Tax=Pseudomonas TaxID=286 RepID=Q847K4_PSEPU|nr:MULTISPECIES: hypothetical protein [Pseudomonas]AAO64261.1 unknown [Pseudomonas putida]ACQ63475.1 unknown [Pseudomonas fluorescens]APV43353.1 hypothetical protein PFAS1_29030 [Pseudomonas frederiksbergensis]EXF91001.1 hypothetical protein HK44_029225 [Pseudomonas fluorescens HK44]OPK08844.1 hypothetical protein BZ163_19175 [Pseudomonas sp. VI4.1]